MRSFHPGWLSLLLLAGTAAAAPEKDAERAARYTVELEKDPLSAEAPDRYPQPITADDFLRERLREIKLLA